jgi:nucleoside-diphosphate-sugar epimerase
MRVLVTGAAGFVGRALIRSLGDAHQVVALDRDCAGLRVERAIAGDLTDPDALVRAFADPVDAIVHLATVPGGAAEADPALGWRINMDGSFALLDAAARHGNCPRILFASSIAVFGDPLPDLFYGAHKAMIEQWVATLTRRGAINGLSLRLPGIVARPRAPSGMKSAFMSDVFHALQAREPIILPVSPEATMWLMSVERIADNIRHALEGTSKFGEPYAVTLPAIRTDMAGLIGEISRQTGADPALVSFVPDAALEAGFGRQPPLMTGSAEALGFANDISLTRLVEAALRRIGDRHE